ncbi:hypothetical protein CTI12_AA378240 [Artemisia annua]|uniref:Uncharacterized protein n=1 Tax=Artemisia annua TaxID=35608 RepID=A0A2U1MIC8_ARTAN|nr:hypothetical protein CTI12_AA378240 [Artemisia annua]
MAVHNDKEQKEQDIIRKYFVRMGLPFVLLSILALYVAVGSKVFEDAPTTIGYLSMLIILGLFWFTLGILLDMRGLFLRVYASAGLCIQMSMILIFSIHFVWPRHEIAFGLVSSVLVSSLCFLANRREGKMELKFLRDIQQNERNEQWKFFVHRGLPWMNYAAVSLFFFNTWKAFENAPTTSVSLAVLNGLGLVCYFWAFVLRGLRLRVFAFVGLGIQICMIFIFLAHFVWPGHEIVVGLISIVLMVLVLVYELHLARLYRTQKRELELRFFF